MATVIVYLRARLKPQDTSALPHGNRHRYPLNRRLGGPNSQSGHFGKIKYLAPAGIRIPDRQACCLVTTILTTLSWIIKY